MQEWFSKALEILKQCNIELDMSKVAIKVFDGTSAYFIFPTGLTVEVNFYENTVYIYKIRGTIEFHLGVKPKVKAQ